MVRQLLFVLAGLPTLLTATNVRRVAQIPSGPHAEAEGDVVCCDSDHDSMPELIFHTYYTVLAGNQGNEYWEHQGWNRFSLIYADTGVYPPPPGITTGNAIPFAAGDIDDDGLTDIVCIGIDKPPVPDTFYCVVMTLESPDSFSYPCSLSWYYRYSDNGTIPIPTYYPPDLDKDGHKEVFCATPSLGWCIWENTGDNQNALVWRDTIHAGWRLTFGDFDLDGRENFASAGLGSMGLVSVWECTGDDQYEVPYRDTVLQPNGADVFMTNDIDGDSLPEFYAAFENVPRGKIYLYMWEANQLGGDVYHRTLVDSVWFSGTDWGRISECGDIDADGLDECIWTTPDIIKVYKATGDDQLQEVWHWDNDHGGFRSLVSTVYDINNDGYDELITAGNAKISVFEVDAVDLLSPNGGSFSVGDTVSIRWTVNTPPRCDSLSLFLRRDSLWNLDTIAHGLPATDTLYRWVVPSGVPDTGRVVVIAYGEAGKWGLYRAESDAGAPRDCPRFPSAMSRAAWQFDISDSVIDFTGGGVAEGIHNVPLEWALSVSPNPARGSFTVRYDVPRTLGTRSELSDNSVMSLRGAVPVFTLGVHDASGRLVRSLSEGDVASGGYEVEVPSGALPTGIYFLRLDTPGFRAVKKAVVAR